MDILKYIATIKEVQSVSKETLNGVRLQLSQKQKEQKMLYTTIESVAQDCSARMALKPNPLVSSCETFGMYSSLRPQSRSELFCSLPDENK